MSNRIPGPTHQSSATIAHTEVTTAAKAANLAVKPETLASFSPAERDAAEEMLAAYRTAIRAGTDRNHLA